MTTQTFIFVHDQKIILDYLKVNKFNELQNLKYVFVGSGDVSEIRDIPNIIICRELPFNIEEYPKLTSFTGWYAIWKNKLYDDDFINLFEYDINISDEFSKTYNNNIDKNTSIIGYIPFNPHDYNFLKHSPWSIDLINSIFKNHNLSVLNEIGKLPKDTICSMTSNHTFNKKYFEEYMMWIEPMIDDIKKSLLSGHQVERSISSFYLLNKIKNVKILPNILDHFQFDSHQTQAIPQQKLINNYNKLL